jgi:low temperature requirement protein LtrA
VRLAAIRPPRLRTLDEAERTATWLELFYDLVFVAAVAVLGGRLLADSSWPGALSYSAYFFLLWWLWASHTFYADRFDTDDLVYRNVAAAQIVAIVVIAASMSTGESASTLAFAVGYAAARLILLALYARAYRHVEAARILCAGYLKGFGIAAVLWVAAVFVPEPARFWVWGVALAVDLATPYIMRKEQARVPLDVSHLPERFGLFTILVLGESIAAAIVGLGHVNWDFASTVTAILGVTIATSLWWIYFDNLDGFNVRRRGDEKNWRPTVWIYTHLPLAIAIAMAGVGVEHAIVASAHAEKFDTSEQWLLAGAIGAALFAMAIILEASRRRGDDVRGTIINARLIGVGVVAVAGLFGGLGPSVLVALLAVACVGQVAADLVIVNLAENRQVAGSDNDTIEIELTRAEPEG